MNVEHAAHVIIWLLAAALLWELSVRWEDDDDRWRF